MLSSPREWQALDAHYEKLLPYALAKNFAAETGRAERYSLEAAGLYFDFSKHWLDQDTLALWEDYANNSNLNTRREQLFTGALINNTEQRAALHTALRGSCPLPTSPSNLAELVADEHAASEQVVAAILDGTWRSVSNETFTDVIHLGTGGSHLGPALACSAITKSPVGLNVHFLPNIDHHSIKQTVQAVNPARTLLVIASKSFGTQEAFLNAEHFFDAFFPSENLAYRHQQVLAITANVDKATAWGIPAEHCLTFADWVGGRYSIWSAIGTTVALHAGSQALTELRAGAADMDHHFFTAPFTQNAPCIAASLATGYRNFAKLATHAVMAYSDGLHLLPNYLQQLEMESNGKRVDYNGNPLAVKSSPIVWGGTGTNAQHAVMQMLHQGTDIAPVDFVGVIHSNGPAKLQKALLANCLAQSSALMKGRRKHTLQAEKLAAELQPHCEMPGNRPSTTILLPTLNAYHLGALLAFYEHKVFCQSVFWGVNPFDQWGVELGKQIAHQVQQAMEGETVDLDGSTQALLARISRD